MKPSELIKNPKNWVKHNLACDKYGRGVELMNGSAFSFCLIGALERCAESPQNYTKMCNKIRRYLKINYNILGYNALTDYNDCGGTTHEDVINLLKECNL